MCSDYMERVLILGRFVFNWKNTLHDIGYHTNLARRILSVGGGKLSLNDMMLLGQHPVLKEAYLLGYGVLTKKKSLFVK